MELYCSLILGFGIHVQDRWETENVHASVWSRCWDTTLVCWVSNLRP